MRIVARRVWRDTRAQDALEYALLAGFLAVAMGAAMPAVASSLSSVWTKVNTSLTLLATPKQLV